MYFKFDSNQNTVIFSKYKFYVDQDRILWAFKLHIYGKIILTRYASPYVLRNIIYKLWLWSIEVIPQAAI